MAYVDFKSAQHQTVSPQIRQLKTLQPFLKLHDGGIVFTSGGQRVMQNLTNVIEFGQATLEYLGEETIQDVGGCALTYYTGTKVSISATIRGGDYNNLSAIIGQDSNVDRVIKPGVYNGATGNGVGDLVFASIDPVTGETLVSDLYSDVSVRVTELPGMGATEPNYSVTFEAEDKFVGRALKANWSPHVWWDNTPSQPTGAGTFSKGVTNGPDAATLVFNLMDSNYAYTSAVSVAATLAVLPIDNTKTGLGQYFPYLRFNGVQVLDSEATYASGAITFGTGREPAALGILECMALIDGTGATEYYAPAMFVPGDRDMTEPWINYQL